MKLKTSLTILAAALSVNAQARDFSNIYFFGDSLTDSGAFSAIVPAGTGTFSTHPGTVWSQNLAAAYGRSISSGLALNPLTAQFVATGGNNYAIGGARVTSKPGVFGDANNPAQAAIAANITPLTDQITLNLSQTGGVANSRALYAFWGGANDVFFQAGAAPLIGAATAGANVVAAAGQAVTQVNRLRSAGAGTVVVVNLPDMGRNPYATGLGAAGAGALTQMSGAFNDTLRAGLVASGATNVVYLDSRALLTDAANNPGKYGFTNTTIPVCGANSSLGCGAAQQVPGINPAVSFFADGVHPTAAAHKVISDWAYATLEAPTRLAGLSAVPLGRLGAQWRSIDNRVRDFATQAKGGQGIYVTGDYAPSKLDATTTSAGLDGNGKSITVGYDRALGSTWMLGAAFGYSEQKFDLTANAGRVNYDEIVLSGYASGKFGNAYLDGTLSYASLDFGTINRTQNLGVLSITDTGATKGRQWGFKLGGGYNFTSGAVTHGPIAALAWEKVNVNGYSETASVTAMSFGNQSRQSMRHRLGWQVVMDVPTSFAKFRPYVRVTHEKEYKENQGTLTAGFVGSPFTFSTPTTGRKDSWGLFAAGTTMAFKDLNVNLGYQGTFSQSGARNHAVQLGLSVPF